MSRRARLGAMWLFLFYAALFPGSTITVALGRVPDWGVWMGSALLILQGIIVILWLAGQHGTRGVVAGLAIGFLGFGVEFIGEQTGFPFGRYVYTDLLVPKLFGVVPLAISCAWVMVTIGARAIAARFAPAVPAALGSAGATAALVLLLDLQIETVAAKINGYWIWIDTGPYYGVPTGNFVAWWLVGFGMAWLAGRLLGDHPSTARRIERAAGRPLIGSLDERISPHIPALLYFFNTGMFAAINFAHGYRLAGAIGTGVLLVAGVWVIRGAFVDATRPVLRQRVD